MLTFEYGQENNLASTHSSSISQKIHRLLTAFGLYKLDFRKRKEQKDGHHYYPPPSSEDMKLYRRAVRQVMIFEPWMRADDNMQHSMAERNYGAFALLTIVAVPALRYLTICDHENATVNTLSVLLKRLAEINIDETATLDDYLSNRLSTVRELSYNVDSDAGTPYSEQWSRVDITTGFLLPNIQKLEFFVPRRKWGSLFGGRWRNGPALPSNMFPVSKTLTNIVIRHSSCISDCLQHILLRAPQLRSLTCELFHDTSKSLAPDNDSWFDMAKWSEDLSVVHNTLESLVLSVEICDSTKHHFEQPKLYPVFSSCLDLLHFDKLRILEAPIPFITGDSRFSIYAEWQPRLPPKLKHLCLRTDMTTAQWSFPLHKTRESTYVESYEESERLINARMNLSYIFHASHILLDYLAELKVLSVWQPADPTLSWCKCAPITHGTLDTRLTALCT